MGQVRSNYLKMVKKYHPDAALAGIENPSEELTKKIEDRFKEFTAAYDRLCDWIDERDKALE